MQIAYQCKPGNTAAQIRLEPNETVTAEAGSMIAMSGSLRVETSTHQRNSGGMAAAFKRLLTGESFFLNHFHSAEGGEIWLAPTLPGDIIDLHLDNQTLIVQSGSFVASADGITLGMGWQGFKSLFSGESLFWLKISGRGSVLLNSFGAIYPIEVDGTYIVDTGHIVAFDEGLTFTLSKAGKSWISSILGGEGLVCKFSGKGTVWCQSHNPIGFGKMLGLMLKPR